MFFTTFLSLTVLNTNETSGLTDQHPHVVVIISRNLWSADNQSLKLAVHFGFPLNPIMMVSTMLGGKHCYNPFVFPL